MSKMYFKRDIFFKDFPVDYVDLKLLSIFNPLTRPCLMIGMSFIRVVGLALAAYFILLHHSFVTRVGLPASMRKIPFYGMRKKS